MEGDGDGEDETATAVRGFEGGALVLGTSFCGCAGLLGCGGALLLGASFCTTCRMKGTKVLTLGAGR